MPELNGNDQAIEPSFSRMPAWEPLAGVGAPRPPVPLTMPEANRLYAEMGFERTERFNENPLPGVVFFRLSLD